jgi:hypothetical protein
MRVEALENLSTRDREGLSSGFVVVNALVENSMGLGNVRNGSKADSLRIFILCLLWGIAFWWIKKF